MSEADASEVAASDVTAREAGAVAVTRGPAGGGGPSGHRREPGRVPVRVPGRGADRVADTARAAGDWHGLDRGYVRVADGAEAARLAALVEPSARLDPLGVLAAWGRAAPSAALASAGPIEPLDRTAFAGIHMAARSGQLGPEDGSVGRAGRPGRRGGASGAADDRPGTAALRGSLGAALIAEVAAIADSARGAVALALGGGIDAAVVLAAWRHAGAPLPPVLTLATGLPGYDEVDAARAIVGAVRRAVRGSAPSGGGRAEGEQPAGQATTARGSADGLEVVRVEPAEIAALLPDAVAACERPLYNLHPVARFALARAARARGFTTLVTGDGADALLAGRPDDDYVPVVAALVRASGLRLASPFLRAPVISAALAGGPDPDKRALRELARALGLPAWLTNAPKRSRLFPAVDFDAVGLGAMWRPAAVARLRAELGLERSRAEPKLARSRAEPKLERSRAEPAIEPRGDRDRVCWMSLDLLTCALRGDR